MEKEKASDKKGIRVLIIDDDKNIARTFSQILRKNGFETDTAETGKEAVAKTTAEAFDVALIDICLPDMNGADLIRKLVNHERKMLKIVVTGFPTMANGDAHPDAYLLKPVKPQELLSLIRQKTSQA